MVGGGGVLVGRLVGGRRVSVRGKAGGGGRRVSILKDTS